MKPQITSLASIVLLIVAASGCSQRVAKESPVANDMDHSTMTQESHASMHGTQTATDSGYAAMQQRGGMAMGVDQYTSQHTFDITGDGGRIALQRDTEDSLAVAQIRAHMRLIQHAFEAGDFSTPAFVHQRDMPGTATMARKRSVIKYVYSEIPRGGEVRIITSDAEARVAIAEFLKAQRSEHHASGT